MSHPTHSHAFNRVFSRKKAKRNVDALAYTVGVLGNAAVIPQIIRAWEGKAPGLAILTWLLFVGVGLIWLAYAVLHKQKPLILAQVTCLAADLAVVVGWAFNNSR
jgi:uncharacterized protein with PQ loop repeat